MRMRATLSALAGTAALVAGLPAGADAATTVPTCTSQRPTLRWVVDRNASGRDRSRRAISLANAGGNSASAVKPIRVTIVRGGKTRTLQFNSLNGEYRYRAKKGERVGAMAVYAEDSSGYTKSTVQSFGTLPVKLPVDVAGTLGALTPLVESVLGPLANNLLTVALPGQSVGGVFQERVCARMQPLVVQERSAARSARTYRR